MCVILSVSGFYISKWLLEKQSKALLMLLKFTNSTLLFFSGSAVMSDFIESEAEESEEEFDEKDLKPKKTQRFMEEDGET